MILLEEKDYVNVHVPARKVRVSVVIKKDVPLVANKVTIYYSSRFYRRITSPQYWIQSIYFYLRLFSHFYR